MHIYTLLPTAPPTVAILGKPSTGELVLEQGQELGLVCRVGSTITMYIFHVLSREEGSLPLPCPGLGKDRPCLMEVLWLLLTRLSTQV